jgi:hypothetical protein
VPATYGFYMEKCLGFGSKTDIMRACIDNVQNSGRFNLCKIEERGTVLCRLYKQEKGLGVELGHYKYNREPVTTQLTLEILLSQKFILTLTSKMYRPSITSSLCALLALISTPLVLANSGFQASCADWALSETGYSLTGTCTTANGGKLTTTLDLDKCVANSFGNLVGRVK